MAGGDRGGRDRKADRELLSAVAWMRQHEEPLDEEILADVLEIGRRAKRPSVRLAAYREFLSRWDPPPKDSDEPRGPVSIHVAIVTSGRTGLSAQGHGVAVRIGRGNGDRT